MLFRVIDGSALGGRPRVPRRPQSTTTAFGRPLAAMATEVRLASVNFASLGLVLEFAPSLILPHLVGQARAAEKLLLGDPFTALLRRASLPQVLEAIEAAIFGDE